MGQTESAAKGDLGLYLEKLEKTRETAEPEQFRIGDEVFMLTDMGGFWHGAKGVVNGEKNGKFKVVFTNGTETRGLLLSPNEITKQYGVDSVELCHERGPAMKTTPADSRMGSLGSSGPSFCDVAALVVNERARQRAEEKTAQASICAADAKAYFTKELTAAAEDAGLTGDPTFVTALGAKMMRYFEKDSKNLSKEEYWVDSGVQKFVQRNITARYQKNQNAKDYFTKKLTKDTCLADDPKFVTDLVAKMMPTWKSKTLSQEDFWAESQNWLSKQIKEHQEPPNTDGKEDEMTLCTSNRTEDVLEGVDANKIGPGLAKMAESIVESDHEEQTQYKITVTPPKSPVSSEPTSSDKKLPESKTVGKQSDLNLDLEREEPRTASADTMPGFMTPENDGDTLEADLASKTSLLSATEEFMNLRKAEQPDITLCGASAALTANRARVQEIDGDSKCEPSDLATKASLLSTVKEVMNLRKAKTEELDNGDIADISFCSVSATLTNTARVRDIDDGSDLAEGGITLCSASSAVVKELADQHAEENTDNSAAAGVLKASKAKKTAPMLSSLSQLSKGAVDPNQVKITRPNSPRSSEPTSSGNNLLEFTTDRTVKRSLLDLYNEVLEEKRDEPAVRKNVFGKFRRGKTLESHDWDWITEAYPWMESEVYTPTKQDPAYDRSSGDNVPDRRRLVMPTSDARPLQSVTQGTLILSGVALLGMLGAFVAKRFTRRSKPADSDKEDSLV